ncbi:MAG: hydantoinase/oxoprolinase family protein [Alphaproteobacteria bacterium]|nr:hydantoinase/oxoprolinase family protein [Alphaproteobacteria bacterium]
MTFRIGVDIGGTFTDFALFDETAGRMAIHKQLTTPKDPSLAVIEGVDLLVRRENVSVNDIAEIVHGTTLVTNAVIERKGAVTGMLVTKGFRDVLDIGLERRYDLFDLRLVFPPPIVPRERRVELDERVLFDGSVRQKVSLEEARAGIRSLVDNHQIKALAVCLLHAYANPEHELAIRALVEREFPDLFVSTSAEIFPFLREYERWTTTTINAYAQPMVDRYLANLEGGLRKIGFKGILSIMASNGGTVTPALARRYPVRMLESGPAAGVLMSAHHGRTLDLPNLLSFDMGGTTAKGSLVRDMNPLKKYEMEVARVHEFKRGSGLPVKVPVIDMIEIGAGGGSIGSVDDRGVIRVGPHSAGADPGPACYGRGGTAPTLTDANLVLGYLDPGFFLGGGMKLDLAAAKRAIEKNVGKPLNLALDRAAWGIHEIINEDVARAFRVHASERGFDYRGCSMIAFGGSGPVHAMRIARKLKIPRVIFPVGAGVMSAFGLLASPRSFEIVKSEVVFLDSLTEDGLAARFAPLVKETTGYLRASQTAAKDIRIVRRLDVRYFGQGYELEVTLPEGDEAELLRRIPELFAKAYESVFSISFLDQRLEIAAWKVEAVGPLPPMRTGFQLGHAGASKSAQKGTRRAYSAEQSGYADFPVFDRYALKPGANVMGPALIEENESTCVIGAGDRVVVDERFNLVADIVPEAGSA